VEAELCGLVQRRTAWLPFSPVTAEFQGTSAAPGTAPRTAAPRTAAPCTAAPRTAAPRTAAPRTAAPVIEVPVIAEILELALFALADLAPPGRADILVHAEETVLEILLTLTPVDVTPEGAGDAVAARVSLAELAQALGGTARASFRASPWRAWIRLPSRPPAGELCPGWCGRCTICRSPSSAPA
jgi:hypothetical protein